jgi:hypothetical protein
VPTKQAETSGQEFHTRTSKVKNRFFSSKGLYPLTLFAHTKNSAHLVFTRKSKIGLGAAGEKTPPAAKEREQIGRDVKG